MGHSLSLRPPSTLESHADCRCQNQTHARSKAVPENQIIKTLVRYGSVPLSVSVLSFTRLLTYLTYIPGACVLGEQRRGTPFPALAPCSRETSVQMVSLG